MESLREREMIMPNRDGTKNEQTKLDCGEIICVGHTKQLQTETH